MTSKIIISGKILVMISIIIQLNFFIYFYNKINNNVLKILYLSQFPIFFIITSFFCFYTVNLIYNIIVPARWINQNSKYITWFKPIVHKYIISSNNINLEFKSFFSQNSPNFKKSLNVQNISDNKENLNNKIMCIINKNLILNSKEQINSIYYKPIIKTNTNYDIEKVIESKIIITIQIPVYTESFDTTLKKTFDNMVEVCNKYNNQNNKYKINFFINDDGMKIIDDSEKQKRLNYYSQYDCIFWIGRPKENRTGKFKKASNMNFCIRQVLLANYPNPIGEIYYDWEYLSNKFSFEYKKTNCHDFQFGKYILLFDSDSSTNVNCVDKLIYEIENNPKIGFLQMKTNAKIICGNLWEKIIAYFTNNIYEINFLYSCSNGFPAPLVGHNCMLRFDVIMEVEKNINGYSPREYLNWKVWDENRVSEDFVMSLNMMDLGYYGKYIYFDCEMKEGVTLNIIDEIIKLKKYMYGINEIIFNPFRYWLKKGITTEICSLLIFSKQIDIFTKYALISYIGSYYAICISPIISLIYYFINIMPSEFNNIFLDSNYAIMSFIIIFLILSMFSNVIIISKNNNISSYIKLIFNELYYGILLMGFFSSLPYHLIISNIDFFFSRNISWSTTNKSTINLKFKDFISEYKFMYVIGSFNFIIINSLSLFLYIYKERNYFIYSIPFNIILFFHLIYPFIVL
jgi:hypothetical protein